MDQVEDIEIQLLLEGLYLRYGYDFRGYSPESMKRRVLAALARSNCKTISQMLDQSLHDPVFYKTLVSDLTVNVTEMFRDPEVYRCLREHVVPVLRTYPSIRIWHAGCATGEEVYSMAILLYEEGLYDKTLFYATDISLRALEVAKQGIYPADQIQNYTANYQKAGGVESFSSYYTADQGGVRINPSLQKNILFSPHNLATDDIFSEVHMVFCRNVLIYFNRDLQQRVLDLLYRSLVRRGYLCLGSKETVEFSGMSRSFEVIGKEEKIYKKI